MLPIIALSTVLVSQFWDDSGESLFGIHPPAAVECQQSSSPSPVLPPTAPAPPVAQDDAEGSLFPLTIDGDLQFINTDELPDVPVDPQPPPDYVTRQELQAEAKTWAWRKGDLTIVPYGMIWGSMSYDSQRAKIGDYALWFESPDVHYHDPDFNVDAKSSRVGIDFTGPPSSFLCGAKVDGKVEVDFQGQFVTRNKPGLLLRHAYVEAVNDRWRLLVGQTWDIISPLGIPTLNYTAGSAVGNLGYRRAQFRAERFLPVTDIFMVTLQGSINGNVVTDFVTDSASSTSADPGPYPDVQYRTAFTIGRRYCPGTKLAVLGIGGHYGIQSFDFRTAPIDLGVDVPSYSFAADFLVPVTRRFGVQGEFFTGCNLSNYMGGILQGVDRVTHKGIHSTGGWIDIYVDWLPNLHTNSGFSIDDPLNHDMTSGRACNQMLFNNVIWDANKHLQFGAEVDVWQTRYITLSPGKGVRLEFATRYKF